MSKIRESARDEICAVRYPGVCTFDSTTTVLAHMKPAGAGMMGSKGSDIVGCYMCDACHALYDMRTPLPDHLTDSERQIYAWEGMARTLLCFLERGLIKIC